MATLTIPALPHSRSCFRSATKTDSDTFILPGQQESTGMDTPWHVVVFNDPVNLMSYVTLVIQRIFGYPESKARLMMLDVHQKGSCVVWTGAREQAEFYVHQLQSYQLRCSMRRAAE